MHISIYLSIYLSYEEHPDTQDLIDGLVKFTNEINYWNQLNVLLLVRTYKRPFIKPFS